MVKVVKENGGLVLVNEVTTGIGRTGYWFGYRHYGISPDIVALGKGVGNGYPVSVTGFAPEVIDRLAGRPVKYAQSHQNDPLGAAVARAVIEVIREEDLLERSKGLATTLLAGLEGIQTRTGRIKEIRSRGLMIALELNDDPEASFTSRIHRELVRRGYIVGRRPGLTIDQKDLDAFLEAFEAVLAGVRRGE